MVLGDLEQVYAKKKRKKKKRKETRPSTYIKHQNKLKIKDSNVSHDTIKVLEGNIGKFQIFHIAIFLPIYLLGQGK